MMLTKKLNPGQAANSTSAPVALSTEQEAMLSAAQAALEDTDSGVTPLGSHTTLSSLSTAQTITPTAGATKVLLQAFTQNVRYTLDGTVPTSTTGFQLLAGELREIPVGGGAVIKVIEEAASASVQYQAIG